MNTRSTYLNHISKQLHLLNDWIRIDHSVDPQKMEAIGCGLLNLIYDYNLTAAHVPGIDLADPAKSIAVQVTASTTRQKIRQTVDQFTRGTPGQRLCDQYHTLLILFLSFDRMRYPLPAETSYSLQLLTLADIEDNLSHLSPDKLARIADFLDDQLGTLDASGQQEDALLPPDAPSPLPVPEPAARDLSALSAEHRYILCCCCLLPDRGFPRELLRQSLPESQRQSLSQLRKDGMVTVSSDLLFTHPDIRRQFTETLYPASGHCADFLDRLLLYDRTRFWRQLALGPRRTVLGLLAQTFGRAAELHDPDGSIALRCAAFYALTGDTSTELRWCLQAVRACQQQTPADPWALGHACLRTADCYQRLNQNADSLKLCKKLLSQHDLIPALSVPDLSYIHYQAGLACIGLGKHTEALGYLETALNHSKTAMDQEHPLVKKISENLNICHQALGNVFQARNYKLQSVRSDDRSAMPRVQSAQLTQKLAELEQLKKRPSLFFASKLIALEYEIGNLFLAQGDYPSALEHHMQALTLLEKRSTSPRKQLADSYHAVGMIFSELGDQDEAMNYLQTALLIRQQVPDIPAVDLFRSRRALADLYSDSGMDQYALDFLKQALATAKQGTSVEPLELAGTYTALGNVCRNLDQGDQMKESYHIALQIRKNTLPSNSPELAASYMDLANACIQLSKYRTALEHARSALNIYAGIYPESHPQRIVARNTVTWLETLPETD